MNEWWRKADQPCTRTFTSSGLAYVPVRVTFAVASAVSLGKMVRFRLKNQAKNLVSRTRTAVRQNVVREPKWMRAATVTPPPPLPPARKVKRFQFPYQHLADDFAKKNPDFSLSLNSAKAWSFPKILFLVYLYVTSNIAWYKRESLVGCLFSWR